MRVVVAEDVRLTRERIVRALTDAGIDVVAQAGDADLLLRAVRLKRADAAIVDIRMPPTHTDEGLAAAQRIRTEHPDVGVLAPIPVCRAQLRAATARRASERVGYLLKQRVSDAAVLVAGSRTPRSAVASRACAPLSLPDPP